MRCFCKKELGKFGENMVDRVLALFGWRCCFANFRLAGGEIDRIYCKNKFLSARKSSPVSVGKGYGLLCRALRHEKKICIAEIKTHRVKNWQHFVFLQSELGLLPDLRPKQIQNLYFVGSLLKTAAVENNRLVGCREMYFRLFRVFLLPDSKDIKEFHAPYSPFICGKIVHCEKGVLVTALEALEKVESKF